MSHCRLLLTIGVLLAFVPRAGMAAPTASDWNLLITSGLPNPGAGSDQVTIGTASTAADAFSVAYDDVHAPPAPPGSGNIYVASFRPESSVPSFAHFLDIDSRAPIPDGTSKTWYLKLAPDVASSTPSSVGLNWDPAMIPSDLTLKLSQLAGTPSADSMPAAVTTVDMSKTDQFTYQSPAGAGPTFFAVVATNNRPGVMITSGPAVASPTPTGVVITWTTDVASTSIVHFGTSTQFGINQESDTLATSHAVTLSNLNPGTTYHYQVVSGGATGRDPAATLADLTFMTTLSPIQVTNVQAVAVTSNSFTVTWTTDIASDSEINYAAAGGMVMTQQDAKLTTAHSITVTGLQAITPYSYQVRSAAPGAAGGSIVEMATTIAAIGFTQQPAATPTANGATIAWSTNVPTDGRVEYGTTVAYGSVAMDANASGTSHAVVLTGLAAATTYHYHAVSSPTGGTPLDSGDLTFTTLQTPVQFLQAPTVTQVTSQSATISWTTDVSSTTVVKYGTSASLGSQTTGQSGSSHSVVLAGLTPGTTYHFQVVSSAAGHSDGTTMGDMTFTTLQPLRITVQPSVAAGGLTATTALIEWQTDQPASSLVNYSTDTSLSQMATGTDNTTNHHVQLSGLKPNTTYHFRVASAAMGRDTVVVDGLQFTTNPQVMILSGPETLNLTNTSVAVHWTTDVPSDSLVEYGLDSSFGQQIHLPDLVTDHKVTLTGLAAGTTVHFRVTSAAPGIDAGVSKETTVDLPLQILHLVGPSVTPGSRSVIVTWTTDQPSDSQVEYGATSTYGSSVHVADLATSHSVVVPGLTPTTTYHFRVDSSAPGFAVLTSPDGTFITTSSTPGVTQILGTPSAAVLSGDTVVVTWITDVATDSVVQFGATTAYGRTETDSTLVTSHRVVLTGLTPATQYHFQVSSGGPGAARATSADGTFITGPAASGFTYAGGFNVLDVANDSSGQIVDQTSALFGATTGQERGVAIDSARGILYVARGVTTDGDGRAGGKGGVAAELINAPLAHSSNPSAAAAVSNYTDTGLITAASNPNGLGFAQGVAYDPVSDAVYVLASLGGSPSATPVVYSAPGGTLGGSPLGGNASTANPAFVPLFTVADNAGPGGAALGGSDRGIAVDTVNGTTWVYLAMGQHADVWNNAGGAWRRAWSSDLFPAEASASRRLSASDTGIHAVAVDAAGNSYWANASAAGARVWQFPAGATGVGLEFDDVANGGSSKGVGRPVEFRNDGAVIPAAEFQGATGLAIGGDDQPLFVALQGSGTLGRTVARARFIGDPSASGDTVPVRVVDGFGGGVASAGQDPTLATLTYKQPPINGANPTQPSDNSLGLLYLVADPARHVLWANGFVQDIAKAQSIPTSAAFQVQYGATPGGSVLTGQPQVTGITSSGATISWTLEQPAATNLVEYGTSAAYGQQVSAPDSTPAPSVTLAGLLPGTLYHLRVSSGGASGSLTPSADLTFTTAPPTRKKGDIRGNGRPPTVADVVLVLRAALGLANLTPDQAYAADVAPRNPDGTLGDGRVTVADAVVLLRVVSGLATLS